MTLSTLIKKISRKRDRALARYVPYNTRYRPSGIIGLRNQHPGHGMEHLALSPPFVSKLNLTDDFRSRCSAYRSPVIEVNHPGRYIVRISNGRILMDTGSNMAVISGSNQLIDELSFQWKNDKILPAQDNAFLRQKGFLQPRRYAGTVFSMMAGGGARTYYYHWVMDAMPRLGMLQQSGLFDQVDYFLVPNYAYPYQKQFMEHFGVTPDRIINGSEVSHIQAECLILSAYTVVKAHHPEWVCNWLYDSFAPSAKSQGDRRIYIARGDARRNRKVLNEEEVVSLLRNYGFEICHLSGMSVPEQARLFHSADIVVGAHGAGLTNLVFCQAGTKVLELFPETYVLHPYYDISNKRGLHYDYLLCPADGVAENAVEGQKINLTVNLDDLDAKLRKLTADKS